MSNININELAKRLNLSKGTVSKALRDSYEISEQTKTKVLQLAEQLHYIPNPYASSLRRKKSNTIGVVIPEVMDSYFSRAIKGIESVAREKGYHVLVYLTYESFEREKAILNDFSSGRVDGVLLSVSSETANENHVEETMAKKIPVVFFDRVLENVHTAKITTNDFESCYEATHHLLQQGCKKIAYLSISEHLHIINKRMEGYKQALFDHGQTHSGANVIACCDDNEKNYALLLKILKANNRPDGIIASVEKLTTPVYLACKNLNLSIPEAVKIVSFSNWEAAPILRPSLTTVTQPAFEMGEAAATALFNLLGKRNYSLLNENTTLPSTLVVRESSVFNRS
ncbi:LacI family DNA-binding transcriptional regulator [Flavisolibacter ginsenosidimutans]|uniref:LacI family transcriptional regulator n=1 Tax=Flavisolibacter ginsenosidimutans TaxID=661481 RepID=A0A5B8UGU3_9BACT|nr:LacI family DNA-binding transcriptional regulator [Flavisolibacter ginsenosidimutans]QEC55546.1 LacI family transcriptional regulator [Flavisolibacter ginsenosidimutans]